MGKFSIITLYIAPTEKARRFLLSLAAFLHICIGPVSSYVSYLPASVIKLRYFYIENANPLFTFIHAYATM